MKNNAKKILVISLIVISFLTLPTKIIFAKFSVSTGDVTNKIENDDSSIKATLNGIANPDDKKIIGYFKFLVSDTKKECSNLTVPWIVTPPIELGDGDTDVSFSQEIPFPKNKNIYYCAVARDKWGTVRFGEVSFFISRAENTTNGSSNSSNGTNTFISQNLKVYYNNETSGTVIGPHKVHTALNATNITDTTATLSGSAILTSPTPLYGYFRYSSVDPGSVAPIFCNEVFGDDMKSTREVFLGTGPSENDHQNHTKTFSTDISGLEPNTTYYYCAVASEKNVIEYGLLSSFTTANDPSVSLNSISTKQATSVSSNSANLNGTYNSAVPSSTWFEYRKKKSYQDIKDATISEMQSIAGNFPLSSFNLNLTSPTNLIATNNLNLSSAVSNSTSISAVTNLAQISTKPTNPYQWSGKINYQSHTSGERGIMGYLLKNLTKDTTYEFRAAIQTNITGNNPQISYGDILSFRTSSSSVTDGDVEHEHAKAESTNLSLGDTATPPDDAIVRYHEGIEHVLVRQLMRDYNRDLVEMFGYQDTMNLETFAWDTADFIARTFGYVSSGGKEIRVVTPDIAAYQLVMKDGKLTIYEYFDGKIVDIQDITSTLRNKYEYEYYYTKK